MASKDRRPFAIRYGIHALKYDKLFVEQLEKHKDTDFGKHLLDHRSKEEYLFDIIAGWHREDKTIELLREACTVELQGADKEREILPKQKVTTEQDFILNGRQKVELQYSENKLPFYNVKESKAKRLINEKCPIFFYIVSEDKWFVIGPKALEKAPSEPNPAWRGKVCKKISHKDIKLMSNQEFVTYLREKLK